MNLVTPSTKAGPVVCRYRRGDTIRMLRELVEHLEGKCN